MVNGSEREQLNLELFPIDQHSAIKADSGSPEMRSWASLQVLTSSGTAMW